VASLSSLIGVAYAVHKFSQKPVLISIAGLQKHYDEKLEALQKHYDSELRAMAGSLTKDLNGWSGRIVDNKETLDEQQTLLTGLLLNEREYQTERRYLNDKLDRIEEGINMVRKQWLERNP
jgi:uncharacterized membrane protein YfhO